MEREVDSILRIVLSGRVRFTVRVVVWTYTYGVDVIENENERRESRLEQRIVLHSDMA